MFLGKIVGKVICTQKDESLKGLKLLIVQPMKDEETPKGNLIVAIDTIKSSGEGDFVYLAKSNEASMPLAKELVAADAGIVGIIDHYYVKK